MVTIIFGIQGVGKSSIVKDIISKRPDAVRLYWGEHANKFAQERGLANDIDGVRKMPVRKQKELQRIVGLDFAQTIQKDPEKEYIIETHAALKTRQGFFPGLTDEILKSIRPDLIIVVESHAIDIYHRRIEDQSRRRDHDKTVKEIQLNLDLTRWFAATYSALSGANYLVVENEEGNLDIAVDRICEVLDIYSGMIE